MPPKTPAVSGGTAARGRPESRQLPRLQLRGMLMLERASFE